jgi:nitrogen regulatory protein P-II 1
LRKVEVIVTGASLDRIRDLLGRIGVDGMTISEVRELGPELGHTEQYRAEEVRIVFEPRVRVEIVLEDGRAPALVEELLRATRTGRNGGGHIFVTPVEEAVRIRTDERGEEAL